jgi:hypothetical protein
LTSPILGGEKGRNKIVITGNDNVQLGVLAPDEVQEIAYQACVDHFLPKLLGFFVETEGIDNGITPGRTAKRLAENKVRSERYPVLYCSRPRIEEVFLKGEPICRFRPSLVPAVVEAPADPVNVLVVEGQDVIRYAGLKFIE